MLKICWVNWSPQVLSKSGSLVWRLALIPLSLPSHWYLDVNIPSRFSVYYKHYP